MEHFFNGLLREIEPCAAGTGSFSRSSRRRDVTPILLDGLLFPPDATTAAGVREILCSRFSDALLRVSVPPWWVSSAFMCFMLLTVSLPLTFYLMW